MSKPAAIPFFGDAYLADTTHLTTEEHGAYILLLLAAWRQEDCALPNDDRKLARIAGLTPRKWASIKETILDFWTIEKGRIHQKRLRKERDFVNQKSEANRKSANHRWNAQPTENKQKGGMRSQSEGNAPPPPPKEQPNGCSNNPPPPFGDSDAKPVKKERTPKAKPKSGLPWHGTPDWVPIDAWHRFLSMRRDTRRDVTIAAAEACILKLEKLRAAGNDPAAVLDQSTINQWQGVFAIEGRKDWNNERPNPRDPEEPTNHFVRASLERQAERAAAGIIE